MIISTTSTLEGKTIKEYRGIVFGEAISGINFIEDFTANITNIIGGRVEEYEKEVVNARADAVNQMVKRAERIGANALVGVKIDVESINQYGSMIMVVATGTAVIVE